jgi:hypothetical protein
MYREVLRGGRRLGSMLYRCSLCGQARGEDLDSIGLLERLLRNGHDDAHAEIASILWDR